MVTILDEFNPKNLVNDSHRYMPRVHEVRSPCQWLEHCEDGKCPSLVKVNGNFYCAKRGVA
jgi:hypothetical protein